LVIGTIPTVHKEFWSKFYLDIPFFPLLKITSKKALGFSKSSQNLLFPPMKYVSSLNFHSFSPPPITRIPHGNQIVFCRHQMATAEQNFPRRLFYHLLQSKKPLSILISKKPPYNCS
jgi:hypothetical protein